MATAEKTINSIDELKAMVGQEMGVSEWVEMTQDRVNQFADVTGDHQWIHVDVERAKASALGGPIAHGFLTLSMLPVLRQQGWDGVFLWDHIRYRPPVRAVADPWVALSAIAAHTERIRLGPLVTPLSRRRVHKVARETVTLDHLSRGRLTLGVGLGSDRNDELEAFGEVVPALGEDVGVEVDPQRPCAPRPAPRQGVAGGGCITALQLLHVRSDSLA